MPRRLPATRAVGAMLFAAALTITSLPGPALALDPPRPLPGYHPGFVTERESGVWQDCTWAAASMLLDKWTNGATRVDREKLRKLSGDLEGGSGLIHVERAFARLGFDLKWSPNGGDSVTWTELLDRLRNGGGAILLGDYGKLPRKYARWDPAFWRKTAELDDHALFLDGYDRNTKRVLVMDPLAPAGWAGEWIPVSALKKYAWRGRGGALWTAMTPAAAAAPFFGVELGAPSAGVDATSLKVSWPLDAAPKGWGQPGVTTTIETTPLEDVDPTDILSPWFAAPLQPPVRVSPSAQAPAVPGPASFTTTVPLPPPGVHEVTIDVSETRFGKPVAAAGPFLVFVPGPRAATYVVPTAVDGVAGTRIALSLIVRNSGTESWTDLPTDPWFPLEPRNTRLVGIWVRDPSTDDFDRGVPDEPHPVDLAKVPLEPGEQRWIDTTVVLPDQPGTWHLVVDVVDDAIGSLASAGSIPGDVILEVAAPPPAR